MRQVTTALAALCCGLAMALLVGGRAALPVGVLAGAAVIAAVRHRALPAVRRERAASARQLPVAADLLAAALRAGVTAERAVVVVGQAVSGPVGARLVRVGRALRLGLPPTEAWACLGELPGGDRLARAAVRSAEHGVAMAHAMERLAEDLRCDRAAAAEAAVRRAAALAVLPLGLCFLPAFVLTGVVPVVMSIVSGFGVG